jgi:hypothetical protein
MRQRRNDSKDKITVELDAGLMAALGAHATERNLSMASVVRTAVADAIGYSPPRIIRRYATDAERRDAELARSRARRKLESQLVAAYKSGRIELPS